MWGIYFARTTELSLSRFGQMGPSTSRMGGLSVFVFGVLTVNIGGTSLPMVECKSEKTGDCGYKSSSESRIDGKEMYRRHLDGVTRVGAGTGESYNTIQPPPHISNTMHE